MLLVDDMISTDCSYTFYFALAMICEIVATLLRNHSCAFFEQFFLNIMKPAINNMLQFSGGMPYAKNEIN